MNRTKEKAPEAHSGATSEAPYRENLRATIDRMEKARKHAVAYSKWALDQDLNSTEKTAMNRTYWCGSYLWLRHYLERDQVKISRANFCGKYMQCPFCAILRAKKGVRAAMDRIGWVKRQDEALRPYFVSLTVKNGESLLERYQHLKKAWSKLQARRRHARDRSSRSCCLEYVEGGMGSIEVKRGSGSGLWHPHIHQVMMSREPIDQDELAQEWHKITGDSNQVDVQELRGDTEDELVKSFCEIFKYALKFSDMEYQDILQAGRILRRRQMLLTWGAFRGISEECSPGPESLEEHEGEIYSEYLYEWLFEHNQYGLLKVGSSDGERLIEAKPCPDTLAGIRAGYISNQDVAEEINAYAKEHPPYE